jgi:hypothetical protein
MRSARKKLCSARKQARLIAEALKRDQCAAVLKAQLRSAADRNEYRNTKASIIKFQAAVRGKEVRKQMAVEIIAMKAIKRYCRVAIQRNEFELLKTSSKNIQRYARGWAVRRNVRMQHAAATKVQTAFRGCITKASYKFTDSQIVKMQSVGRMYLQRSKFTKLCKSCVVTQKLQRGRLARKLRCAMMRSLVHVTCHLTRWHRRLECFACAAPTGCKTACCRHRKYVVERSASWSLIDGSINATASALDDKVRYEDQAITLRKCITEHSACVFSSTD